MYSITTRPTAPASFVRALTLPARPALKASALLSLVLMGACSGAGTRDEADAGPQVVREIDGDTTVIRTVSGSVWGGTAQMTPEVSIGVLDGDENYMLGSVRSLTVTADGRIVAMDSQVPTLRVYSADGTWLANWGRHGEGPGELGQPDGGLTVLSDGRIVVRDPGNARFQVYSSDGTPLDTWPVIRGGFNTSNPFALQGDTIMTPQVINLETADVADWKTGYVRVSPTGQILDSMEVPDVGYEAPSLRASLEGSTSINSVPWSPTEDWAWHPDGYFIHGVSDRYAFTLLRPGSPLRIERTAETIPVLAGEREQSIATTTRNMRGTDPNWRWNGPAIPDTKPPWRDLYTGRDGRIWVYRQGAAYEVEDTDFDPTDPDDIEIRWQQDSMFDVFESDGTFLGTVDVPRGFSTYPTPIFDGDNVWATVRDDFDVQQIVRFRITHAQDSN